MPKKAAKAERAPSPTKTPKKAPTDSGLSPGAEAIRKEVLGKMAPKTKTPATAPGKAPIQRQRYGPERVHEVQAMVRSGKSVKEVAEHFGMPRGTVMGMTDASKRYAAFKTG